jgi:hypothetical protein
MNINNLAKYVRAMVVALTSPTGTKYGLGEFIVMYQYLVLGNL